MEQRIHQINTVPIGTILWVMRKNIPDGYYECNGQTVEIKSQVVESNTFWTLGEHDCSEFVSEIGEILKYTDGTGIRTYTMPDLRGKTCIGRHRTITTDNGMETETNLLLAGTSVAGRFPATNKTNKTDKEWRLNIDKDYHPRTEYNHVFSGAYGAAARGDVIAHGAFKQVHRYTQSAGVSSHLGVGIQAIALDLDVLLGSDGTGVSNDLNPEDLIPAGVAAVPIIRVY